MRKGILEAWGSTEKLVSGEVFSEKIPELGSSLGWAEERLAGRSPVLSSRVQAHGCQPQVPAEPPAETGAAPSAPSSPDCGLSSLM